MELAEAFYLNRTLPREYFRTKLQTVYRPILLAKWKAEATYHQRLLAKMAVEFPRVGFFDQEIWDLLIDDAINKKRINNLHFFTAFHTTFVKMNKDPECVYFGKLDEKIELLKKRHYTEDREWRYNYEEGRWRTLPELIERREDCKAEDNY